MTSAALDACLCLLLVSAAAVTVTSIDEPGPERTGDRADSVAETLSVETAQVAYTLRPVDSERTDASPEYERTAHGTLASLLARATVSTVHVDGEPLTRTREGFLTAVLAVVRDRLPARTQVVVEFSPYPGAHLGHDVTVGPTPPPDADVHAATVRASSGVTAPENAPETATTDGFDGLSNAVATALVDGLFPPEAGRLALAGDPPVQSLVDHRYARASEHYRVQTREAIERGDTRTANRRLAEAIADRVAEDLRDRFDSAAAAADSLRLGEVNVSVRTWSP